MEFRARRETRTSSRCNEQVNDEAIDKAKMTEKVSPHVAHRLGSPRWVEAKYVARAQLSWDKY